MDRAPKVTPPPNGAIDGPKTVEAPASPSPHHGVTIQFGPTPSKPGSRLKGVGK